MAVNTASVIGFRIGVPPHRVEQTEEVANVIVASAHAQHDKGAIIRHSASPIRQFSS